MPLDVFGPQLSVADQRHGGDECQGSTFWVPLLLVLPMDLGRHFPNGFFATALDIVIVNLSAGRSVRFGGLERRELLVRFQMGKTNSLTRKEEEGTR